MEFGLVIVTAPMTLPVAVGENAAVKVVVCPAARVMGSEIPLTEKPAPLAVTLEIVTPAVPVFFIWTLCEFIVPLVTVPKVTPVGIVANVAATTPVPVTV